MVAESRRRLATNTIVTTVLVSLLTAKSQFSRLRLHHFISASKNRCSRISVFCRAPPFDAIDSEKYLVMRHVKLARVAATMLRRPEERKARVELTTLHVTAINRAFPTRLGKLYYCFYEFNVICGESPSRNIEKRRGLQPFPKVFKCTGLCRSFHSIKWNISLWPKQHGLAQWWRTCGTRARGGIMALTVGTRTVASVQSSISER